MNFGSKVLQFVLFIHNVFLLLITIFYIQPFQKKSPTDCTKPSCSTGALQLSGCLNFFRL
uniref:Uncharacterized protein n=1 Tax=Arundo donax TaxID=35708 RepID=A0A0A8XVI4_ARUDO